MDFNRFCEKFNSCSECPLDFSNSTDMCQFIFDEAMDNGGKFTVLYKYKKSF